MYQTIKFVKYNKLNQCILKIQSMLKHLCKWPVSMSQSSKLPMQKEMHPHLTNGNSCSRIWLLHANYLFRFPSPTNILVITWLLLSVLSTFHYVQIYLVCFECWYWIPIAGHNTSTLLTPVNIKRYQLLNINLPHWYKPLYEEYFSQEHPGTDNTSHASAISTHDGVTSKQQMILSEL